MKQRICIGILHGNTGIEKMLNTIGAPWERCGNVKDNWKNNFTVIICDKPPGIYKKQLEIYTKSGGAVLDLCNVLNRFNVQKKRVKTLCVNPGNKMFGDLGSIDIYSEVLKHPKAVAVEKTIWINSAETFPYIFCGLPLGILFMNSGTVQKEFFTIGNRVVSEHVNSVSKQKLLHLVLRFLIYLHEVRNIPFVHKWWFPEDSDTVCLFRIDSDFATQDEVKDLTEFLNREKLPNSWFLHVQAHENWLDQFHYVDRSEIAVHGYHHKVYKTSLRNRRNIEEAVKKLRYARFQPNGYASPYGIWNETVEDSLKDFHFNYTSEFSFAYNCLPLFAPGNSLQLPIHPVCIASLEKAGADETEMINYFSRVAETRQYFHDPVAFYHHPSDNHLNVWRNVFKKIKEKHDIRFMTFLEWATWWHKRESATPHVFYSGSELTMQMSGSCNTVRLAVHTDGNKFLITRPVQLSLNKVHFRTFYDETCRNERIRNFENNPNANRALLLKSEFFSKLWRL